MLARVVLLVLSCLFLAACAGSSISSSPSARASSSTSPAASPSVSPSGAIVNEAFCGTVADLESALQSLEMIKVKPANGSKIKDQAGAVKAALTPIMSTAAAGLTSRVDSLQKAVEGVSTASENYATANAASKSAADKRLKKAIATLHTAITDVRQAAACAT